KGQRAFHADGAAAKLLARAVDLGPPFRVGRGQRAAQVDEERGRDQRRGRPGRRDEARAGELEPEDAKLVVALDARDGERRALVAARPDGGVPGGVVEGARGIVEEEGEIAGGEGLAPRRREGALGGGLGERAARAEDGRLHGGAHAEDPAAGLLRLVEGARGVSGDADRARAGGQERDGAGRRAREARERAGTHVHGLVHPGGPLPHVRVQVSRVTLALQDGEAPGGALPSEGEGDARQRRGVEAQRARACRRGAGARERGRIVEPEVPAERGRLGARDQQKQGQRHRPRTVHRSHAPRLGGGGLLRQQKRFGRAPPKRKRSAENPYQVAQRAGAAWWRLLVVERSSPWRSSPARCSCPGPSRTRASTAPAWTSRRATRAPRWTSRPTPTAAPPPSSSPWTAAASSSPSAAGRSWPKGPTAA